MPRAALFVFAVLCACPVLAQGVRPGIRLSLARVEPTGGFTASGLLVVPASRVERVPAPECGEAMQRVTATGRDAHGRIRGAHLVIVVAPTEREVPFGTGPCGASLRVELDDGSVVAPERGSARARLVGDGGLDASIVASAIGPAGVPTTVNGHVTLPSR